MRPFLEWYNNKYPNGLAIFQNLPFSHQLGAFFEYFETIYNLVILANNYGYTIHFTDKRKVPLSNENGMQYTHQRFRHDEPKSVMYGYECGIKWLFENYDLPF